jgi:hypothetical protein
MKKLSVVLFSILFLAIAVLYFFHFAGGSKHKSNKKSDNTIESVANGIAYVNIDSIVYKFKMFEDRKAELLEKQKKAEE